MKLVRNLTTVAVAMAVLIVTAAASQHDATSNKAKIGAPAPSFELKDTSGKTHKLADFKGKTVVLEWFNPGCPWCQKIYKDGAVQETVDAMKKMGDDYIYIAVNSTANMAQDAVVKQSTGFLKQHKLESIPVLMDYSGAVGHAYGAKTTPHMYIIDGEGVLRYMGAFGDRKDPKGNNFVLAALKQMKAGETVSPDETRPWGCSVKYAKK